MNTNSAMTMISVCAIDPQINADIYIDNLRLDQVDKTAYSGREITFYSKKLRERKQRIQLVTRDFNKKKKTFRFKDEIHQ